MNPAEIVAELLDHVTLSDIVGDRIALSQLPQGEDYPYVAYHLISMTPKPVVSFATAPQMAEFRVQISPWSETVEELIQIHNVIRNLLDFKYNVVVAGSLVVSIRMALSGPVSKDNAAGLWTQPVDYIVMYYE